MPGLKDLLKKKDKIAQEPTPSTSNPNLEVPEFKIIRSTTESEEVIQPPDDPPESDLPPSSSLSPTKNRDKKERRHTLGFRRSANAEQTKDPSAQDDTHSLPVRQKGERRLSERFRLHRSHDRSTSADSSTNLPEDLPEAPETIAYTLPSTTPTDTTSHTDDTTHREAQWEKRATLLAQSNPVLEQQRKAREEAEELTREEKRRIRSRSPSISDKRGDDDIQEAIRLHEIGELRLSTAMFGRLGNPKGPNNALAQVLYGLALRHGWGVEVEPEKAIHYLSLAAANSANVERMALESGMEKGGAAKGELVLAIFELANCFRHGWGVKKDPVAARQYYETAANLGDTDAMEEAAWCLVEGFGGAKDKFKAAQYLRLAEQKGHKTVGNSWIWKDKYTPR